MRKEYTKFHCIIPKRAKSDSTKITIFYDQISKPGAASKYSRPLESQKIKDYGSAFSKRREYAEKVWRNRELKKMVYIKNLIDISVAYRVAVWVRTYSDGFKPYIKALMKYNFNGSRPTLKGSSRYAIKKDNIDIDV